MDAYWRDLVDGPRSAIETPSVGYMAPTAQHQNLHPVSRNQHLDHLEYLHHHHHHHQHLDGDLDVDLDLDLDTSHSRSSYRAAHESYAISSPAGLSRDDSPTLDPYHLRSPSIRRRAMATQPNDMPSYPAPFSPHSSGGAHEEMPPQQMPIAPMAATTYHFDHQTHPAQSSPSYEMAPVNGQPAAQQRAEPVDTPTKEKKATRANKACDTCSQRKVKCDTSGPPCKPCAALDVPCTYNRPTKRRGPPNRHAEAYRRQKLDERSFGDSPTSPGNVAATLASLSSHRVPSAESICPMPVLVLLVDDFFTYIHPLTPFPHEPSFRDSFNRREDIRIPGFLSLLASMIKALVASFPRRPRLHLKQHNLQYEFPNSTALIDRCHRIAVESRGVGFLDKNLTIYDAATSYFLGLAEAYTHSWSKCKLYFGETLTILNVLGAHKLESPNIGTNGAPQPPDYIHQELARRVWWVMFAGIRTLQELGLPIGELIMPPPTPKEPYPPLPLEIDDEYISQHQIHPQPAGIVSIITGFNLNVAVYKTLTPLTTMELAYGIDEVFDMVRQRRVLASCLHAAEQVLKSAPPELLLQPGSQPGEFAPSPDWKYPPVSEYPAAIANDHNLGPWASASEARRKVQYEIQKANIYASQLSTRSHVVEKHFNLQDAYQQKQSKQATAIQDPALDSPEAMATGLDRMLPSEPTNGNGYGDTEMHFANQREEIIKELLRVIACITQVNMEPNGGSFVHKIRQIASTLITATQSRMGPYALKAQEDLNIFLDLLVKLDTHGHMMDERVDGDDEEQQLRVWADLRHHQMRFAQAGGFLSEL